MIRLTTGGAATATASQLTYEIVEKLCKSYSTNAALQPIVSKTWSIADTEVVNSISYFTVQCVVNVTYQPKNSCSVCGQKTNTYVEKFVVSFPGSGTVAFTDSNGYTEPTYLSGASCCTAGGVRNVGNIAFTFTAS